MEILIIIIGLLVIAGLTYLFYWIPTKIGYPKAGKYLSILVGIFFAVVILMTVFEDNLFSKKDAIKLLAEQNIKLTDQFEITENKSMWAVGEYYHTFKLNISEQDKTRIANEIKSSKNFNLDTTTNYSKDQEDSAQGLKRIKNYETEEQFIRELFEPKGEGYAPVLRKIEIDKKENTLTFEDIDD